MSLDVARTLITVKNGQTDSPVMFVHETHGDAVGFYPTNIPALNLFAPASLNGGAFALQFAWEDTNQTWLTGQGGPAANTFLTLNQIMLAAVTWRIHASIAPNADTTFKLVKQFWIDGGSY